MQLQQPEGSCVSNTLQSLCSTSSGNHVRAVRMPAYVHTSLSVRVCISICIYIYADRFGCRVVFQRNVHACAV